MPQAESTAATERSIVSIFYNVVIFNVLLVPEQPGDTAEERAAALLAGRHGRGGIQGRSRFLAKNHLKPFIDNALDFLA